MRNVTFCIVCFQHFFPGLMFFVYIQKDEEEFVLSYISEKSCSVSDISFLSKKHTGITYLNQGHSVY